MKIGYARVSSLEQNLDRQLKTLSEYGVDKLFTDKKSGKDTERDGFQDMMGFVREGDEVIVSEMSRLGRSTRDLLDIVEELNNKKVGVVFIKEGITTSGIHNKLIMTIFAGLAEWERDMIRERQAEGIALAKAAGKYKGRPCKKYDKDVLDSLLVDLKTKKMTVVDVSKKLGVSRATVYRLIKQAEEEMNNDLQHSNSKSPL